MATLEVSKGDKKHFRRFLDTSKIDGTPTQAEISDFLFTLLIKYRILSPKHRKKQKSGDSPHSLFTIPVL
ncbi:hypothetical protein SAMN04488132_10563 [Sediminibacterium ginsengisoli]|uniref:Uncharacterized protein n=1 Tax=Sediminibacterium ginsengisoli TaxID=413434 RepID=A0A1T4NYZ0_9BACT|nr:hypothetical protein SAMN04488132_10563 [Sediminibacterium ginsengisoli]